MENAVDDNAMLEVPQQRPVPAVPVFPFGAQEVPPLHPVPPFHAPVAPQRPFVNIPPNVPQLRQVLPAATATLGRRVRTATATATVTAATAADVETALPPGPAPVMAQAIGLLLNQDGHLAHNNTIWNLN